MALFTINLILCTIHHFLPHLKVFFSKELFNGKAVQNPWISRKINAGTSTRDETMSRVKDYLARKGFKLIDTPKGTVAEKGRYSRLLPFLFHLGILIVLIGAIIGSVFGFVGTANVHVKTETNEFFNWSELKDDKLDFTIRVDDFKLEYYPIAIRVGVQDKITKEKLGQYELMERQGFSIKDSPYSVFIIDAVLDFRFSVPKVYFTLFKDGAEVGTYYSDEPVQGFPYELILTDYKPQRIPKTMMVKFQIKEGGKVTAQSDIEVNHPFTYKGVTFYETSFDRDSYGFLYIGFQIVKDPGLEVVYFGFGLLFFAVMPIFFVSHKKIYITGDDDGVTLTAEATKNKKEFKDEFFGYLKELGA